MTQQYDRSQAVRQAWADWQQQALEDGLAWRAEPALEAELLRVWEASDYVVQSCRRRPELLVDLAGDGLHLCYGSGDLRGRLDAALVEVSDQPALARVLRRFRRREMVRVIWRDIAELAPLGETLEDLSELADVCVGAALHRVYAWGCAEMGTPRNDQGEAQPLVVLGMGKLGARELNLSSDIDLIFAFPEHGVTDGRRQLANQQFFTRICQRLVQVIDTQDAEGFVFRVDTRLRPFGSAGPLAMNFDAMEDYYQSQAREWERYAMIKGRVVAGDPVAGRQLEAMLKPFVYRRYLDFGAIESLRNMKVLISQELHRKGMADNIKLGPGGIREIEFIGQAFQLIRGGREPELQIRPILQVLERLGERNYLPPHAVRELTGAYVFLRLLENRLQAWADRQTQILPSEPEARLRLARSMGFAAWDEMEPVLARHRRRVQGHFDAVFAAPQAEEGANATAVSDLWRSRGDGEHALAALRTAGFADPQAALEHICAFRASRPFRSLSTRGQERLEQLMPLLMDAVSALEMPDIPLQRLLKMLERIIQRTAYVAMMVENPIVLSQLVRLTAISPWIAGLLTRHPLLLDELLDPRRLYSPLKRKELEAEADSLLGESDPEDLEQQMERLRQFAQSNRLRVAAADITGNIPLMVVSDYLTDIAEVVLERVLCQAWRHLVQRHGRPAGTEGDPGGFAVVGYGKLGGIELGYGSDLDLVFLHGGTSGGATDGDRPLVNEVFFARLGQRMIHMLTTQTPSGILYETDMRLRPNGASGLLVSSLDAYQTYQSESAWTWEHQALIRARAVAGDPRVMGRFEAIRKQVLSRLREPDQLREEVRDMRERMRAELQRGTPDEFDLKQGVGGIADIEFMVQYAVLRWANEYPDLLTYSDNIRLLDGLERHRLLGNDEADLLRDAYRAFRASYHRNALQEEPGLVGAQRHAEQREQVSALWQRLMHAD